MINHNATYQQLVEKYTAQKLDEVYREGDLYRIVTPSLKTLSKSYGFDFLRTALADYQHKACTRCHRPLTSITDEERWVVDESRLYWCGTCKEQRPVVTINHYPERVMPRLMKLVVQQINDHPDVLALNHDTRQMLGWLVEDQQRSSDDNKWIRAVWSFLYKGEL